MKSSTVLPTLPDRWSALARSTDVRCMAVVVVLSMVVLYYFVATLHAAVARGPWKPLANQPTVPATVLAQQR